MVMGPMAAAAAASAATGEAIARVNERWSAYASAKGYAARSGSSGWAHTVSPMVVGTVDGIAFTLEYVPDASTTLAIATPSAALEGDVEAIPEGMGSRLAKLFGAQDIAVGHAAFDAKYVIKASRAATATALLAMDVCERLMALDIGRFAYDDGTKSGRAPGGLVLIERAGPEDRPAILDAMIGCVVRVARITR
jgi:hypothetical protein